MKKPLIGIIPDWQEPKPGGFSEWRPYYAMRENYSDAVANAGGNPILIPYRKDAVAAYSLLCDGFLIVGAGDDLDPKLYGEEPHPKSKIKNSPRADFEIALIRAALESGKAVLGICNGMQTLNVALGGSLIQHIPDAVPNAHEHSQKPPFDQAAHDIAVEPGTMLHRILGVDRLAVNSSHHQSIKNVPTGTIVSARAGDGVIEGIESPSYRFCLGVQWHPEYAASPHDAKIFSALIGACQ
ncbi:MAG: gamma-glutamyl-gamma-aminobutyrate hydrolase family protein [Alphaproteobacteria bacterium]|nr:MAG: gamma-glutamyl-gamma-aminobutyrate hydrolase family protein [Alphaproteobacteria bacterium]